MILIALVLVALWIAQAFIAPAVVRRLVISKLAELGYPSATATVDYVSLTAATLRDLHSPAGLDVRLVHVTYTPSSLLAGRVGDLVIEDAFADAGRFVKPTFTTTSSAPATRPPFSRMTAQRTRIQIPTTSGPTTADIGIEALEQPDHRLVISADASIPGMRLQATVDTTAGMESGNVSARVDGDLAVLPALLSRNDLAMAGQFHLEAKGDIANTAGPQWNFPTLRIEANADSLTSPWGELHDARIKLGASTGGTREKFVASLAPGSVISAREVRASEGLPPFGVSFAPKDLQLTREADTWNVRSEGADVALGDLQFAFEPGQLTAQGQRVRGRIVSTMDLAQVGESQLLQGLFPILSKMRLGGTAQILFVRAAQAGAEGADLPSLTFRLRNGTIASEEYQLKADGIESQIVLVDPANPHSPPGQTLKMAYGQMGKWEVRDALFQFGIKDLKNLSVEKTELGWLGGRIWSDPYEITFPSPIIRSRVYGRELDLGKLVWIATNEKAWAEGLVDLDIPLAFAWPRMRFGDGYVAARPGGKLHLDYLSDQLGSYLASSDPRFVTDPTYAAIRERVMKALRDFRFSVLRLQMQRKGEHLDTVVQIQGKGDYEGGQEVNLNLAVGPDLDWFLSRYLAMPKVQMGVQ